MLKCLRCNTPLVGKQSKYCSIHHRPKIENLRNYLARLRSYYNRKDTLGLDFLVALYEKQLGKCAITNVEMTSIYGEGRCPTNISIDRIDNSKGYEPTNVQLVCHKVNMMKGESTMKEFIDWCKLILTQEKDPRS